MTKIISWLGTLTSIVGSFVIAFGMMKLGYCFFLVGSASWLYVAFVSRDKALGVLNGTFLIANLIGVYRAFS